MTLTSNTIADLPAAELESLGAELETVAAAGLEAFAAPANAVTGQAYSGGNVIILAAAAEANGWSHGAAWAGYGQWLEIGRQVVKGSSGTVGRRVCVVKDRKTGRERSICKGFRVFHYAQTVAADAPAPLDDGPEVNGY